MSSERPCFQVRRAPGARRILRTEHGLRSRGSVAGSRSFRFQEDPPSRLPKAPTTARSTTLEATLGDPTALSTQRAKAGSFAFQRMGALSSRSRCSLQVVGETSHRFPHVLPDGRNVLFTVTYRSGGRDSVIGSDIAVADLDSGEHVVLFRGVRALYSGTGHIVYVTVDRTLFAAPFDAAELRSSGQSIALATDIDVRPSGWTDLALSSSGTLMYTTGADSPPSELVWVSRDSRETRIDLEWSEAFDYVALSPDETRVAVGGAFEGNVVTDIWVSRLEGGVPQQRTFDGLQNQRPVWTADGLALVYSSDRERIGDLWRVPADGGDDPQLLLRRDRRIADGFLSRDGSWVIYRTSAGVAGSGDILAVSTGADTVSQTLLGTQSGEFAPALSPDGRYIAYVSNGTGTSEVYVKRFLDTGVARWPISNGGGQEPVWAQGGRELFYSKWSGRDSRGRGADRAHFRARATTGALRCESIRAGRPLPLLHRDQRRGAIPHDPELGGSGG